MPAAIPAISTIDRHIYRSNCHVIEGIPRFDELSLFLEERGLEKVVSISEDATRIVGRIQYDSSTNQIVGFTLPLDPKNGMPIPFSFSAHDASVIIDHFANNNSISAFVNVMMAQPIGSKYSPHFCLLIYGSDNKFTSHDVCKRWEYITRELNERNIEILTFATDSDPRYNAAMRKLSLLGAKSSLFNQSELLKCEIPTTSAVYTPLCVQDTVHIGTKMRNLLLKTRKNNRKLMFGRFYIQHKHLQHLITHITKDKHRLTKTVLNPADKQNFNSVLRLCDKSVIELLRSNVRESHGTIKFLEIIQNVIDAFMNVNLTPSERLYKIWYSVFILRIWRHFVLSTKGLTLKYNFLSTYAYSCIELNAHSLVQCITQLRNTNKPQLFQPHLFESQQCESLFRQIRSFSSTYSTVANCSVKEIVSRISKIQLQSDIAMSIGSNYNFPLLNRIQTKHNPIVFDLPTAHEIQNVIEQAQNDALKDAGPLGLITNKKINEIDLSCPIKPFNDMKRAKTNNVNKRLQQDFARSLTMRDFDFEHIKLKNFSEKCDDEIDNDSGFVEVFRNEYNRIVVKKTSLCWFLRNDYAKLSSDRLERVKANTRNKKNNTHIYNLRSFSKKNKMRKCQ